MQNDSNITASTKGVSQTVTSGNFLSKNSRNITFYLLLLLILIIIFYFPSWLCSVGNTCYELKGSPIFRVISGIPLILLLYSLKGIKTWRVIGEFMLLFAIFGIGGAILAYQQVIDVSEQIFHDPRVLPLIYVTWVLVVIGFYLYQSILTTLRRRALVYVIILLCELCIGIAVGTMVDKKPSTPIVTAPHIPMGFL